MSCTPSPPHWLMRVVRPGGEAPVYMNFREGSWKIPPTALGPFLLLLIALTTCPCCCAFLWTARGGRRSPFAPSLGPCFYAAFALTALSVVVLAIAALVLQGEVKEAAETAKRAAFSCADVLLNGFDVAPESGPQVEGFMGFRRMVTALELTAALATNESARLSDIEHALRGGEALGNFPQLAMEYTSLLRDSQGPRMKAAGFYCDACSDRSIAPLLSAVDKWENLTQDLEASFNVSRSFLTSLGEFDTMRVNKSLTDLAAVFRYVSAFHESTVGVIKRWEHALFAVWTTCRLLLLGGFVSVLIGLCSVALCTGHQCPLFAWWFTYGLAFMYILQSAFLPPLALAALDAAKGARVVLSRRGADKGSVVGGLTRPQEKALFHCLLPQNGDQDIWDFLPRPIGDQQVAAAALARIKLAHIPRLQSLDHRSLDTFFSSHDHLDTAAYAASWDARQTLTWKGVGTMEQWLRNRSGEWWIYDKSHLPLDCGWPENYDSHREVMSSNCFFLTELVPDDAEVEERYGGDFVPDFQRARNASVALRQAQGFREINAGHVKRLRTAWNGTVALLDLAVVLTKEQALQPMQPASGAIVDLVAQANCSRAGDAYAEWSEALECHLASSCVFLWVALSLLVACTSMLALAYCVLWTGRRPWKGAGWPYYMSLGTSDSSWSEEDSSSEEEEWGSWGSRG